MASTRPDGKASEGPLGLPSANGTIPEEPRGAIRAAANIGAKEVVIPFDRAAAWHRSGWMTAAAVVMVLPSWVILPQLRFVPSGMSNRFGDYSIAVILACTWAAGLALAVLAARWARLAGSGRAVGFVVGESGIWARLHPMEEWNAAWDELEVEWPEYLFTLELSPEEPLPMRECPAIRVARGASRLHGEAHAETQRRGEVGGDGEAHAETQRRGEADGDGEAHAETQRRRVAGGDEEAHAETQRRGEVGGDEEAHAETQRRGVAGGDDPAPRRVDVSLRRFAAWPEERWWPEIERRIRPALFSDARWE